MTAVTVLKVAGRRLVDTIVARVGPGLRAIPAVRRARNLPRGRIRALGARLATPGAWRDGSGARYEVLHPPLTVTRPAPAGPLGRPIPDGLEAARRHAHPEVFLARLPEARLLGPDGTVITPDGDVVEQSTRGGRWLERDRALRALRLPPPTRLAGEHYTVASLYAEGYAHWVLEVLPRLIAFERLPATRPALVLARALTAWQAESLDLLGLGSVPRITLGDRHLSLEALYLPSFVGTPGHPHPWACAFLRDRFVPSAPPAAGGRRLYVTRRRARRRRVVNERELEPILADLGFEIVECEALSFRQQVGLFREAEVVAGPHGAGLTNVLWAPPGCRVLELFGHRCVRGLFYALAGLRAQPYAFLVGASEGSVGVHRDEGAYDLRVPPEDFARALRSALGAAPTAAAR